MFNFAAAIGNTVYNWATGGSTPASNPTTDGNKDIISKFEQLSSREKRIYYQSVLILLNFYSEMRHNVNCEPKPLECELVFSQSKSWKKVEKKLTKVKSQTNDEKIIKWVDQWLKDIQYLRKFETAALEIAEKKKKNEKNKQEYKQKYEQLRKTDTALRSEILTAMKEECKYHGIIEKQKKQIEEHYESIKFILNKNHTCTKRLSANINVLYNDDHPLHLKIKKDCTISLSDPKSDIAEILKQKGTLPDTEQPVILDSSCKKIIEYLTTNWAYLTTFLNSPGQVLLDDETLVAHIRKVTKKGDPGKELNSCVQAIFLIDTVDKTESTLYHSKFTPITFTVAKKIEIKETHLSPDSPRIKRRASTSNRTGEISDEWFFDVILGSESKEEVPEIKKTASETALEIQSVMPLIIETVNRRLSNKTPTTPSN